MRRTHTLVIGGGQAGLAMSRCLSERGIDHVVLEKGRIGERWRSERWDSLRMLTPRWQSRLPGLRCEHPEPHGYMTTLEVTRLLEHYAASFAAPVETESAVASVEPLGAGFRVRTTRGEWRTNNVVIATGHCDVPFVPDLARRLPPGIEQLTPPAYRRPGDLPEGGALVVGASASGVQIAEEIHASGRPVTLAVGRHTRLPRSYRGRDIMWWLEAAGVLDEPIDTLEDPSRWRRQPSLQLVGRPGPGLDLARLAAMGIRVLGRASAASGSHVRFAGDLARTTAAAHAKLSRLLARIDALVDTWGLHRIVPPAERPAPIALDAEELDLDLRREHVATVIWATGFRRCYPWLRVPVLDSRGEILHSGGVTAAPGLYVLGLQFLRRRSSSFLDGVGKDAEALAAHIALHRRSGSRAAA
jgi:putative flavoprotein involved in K+ transport